MIYIFKGKIDRLAATNKSLEKKKERVLQKMNERNAVLTAKVTKLTNKTINNEVNASKKMRELDLKIDRVMGNISNEKIYVSAVAKAEQDDYYYLRKLNFDKPAKKGGR